VERQAVVQAAQAEQVGCPKNLKRLQDRKTKLGMGMTKTIPFFYGCNFWLKSRFRQHFSLNKNAENTV
jgi:hypothetical protein